MLNNGKRTGFALLIALSLMAFMVLLMVSITAMIQVELQSGIVHQKNVSARHMALTGLRIALGELQAEAGPDQRATAKLNILTGNGNSALYDWTGVWVPPTSEELAVDPGAQTQLRVLASLPSELEGFANITDLESAIAGLGEDDTVALARLKDLDGGGGAEREVRVPLINVEDEQGTVARFGYWVDDVSLKVKVIHDTERDTGFWHMAKSPGLSLLSVFEGGKLNAGSVEYIISDSQLPNLTTPTSSALAYSERFTSYGYGVLANSRDGGLRRDLPNWLEGLSAGEIAALDAELLPTEFPDTREDVSLRRLMNFFDIAASIPGDADAIPVMAVRPRSPSEVGIFPLLTTVQMGWGVGVNSTGNLLLTMRPIIVMVNPYNVRLEETDYVVQRAYQDLASVRGAEIELYYRAALPTDGVGEYNFVNGSTALFLDDYTGDPLGPSTSTLEEKAPLLFRLPDVAFEPGEIKIFTYAGASPAEYVEAGVALSNTYDPDRAYIYIDTGVGTGIIPGSVAHMREEFAFLHSLGYSNFTLFREVSGGYQPLQKIDLSRALMSTNVTASNRNYISYPSSFNAYADRHDLKRSDWDWNTINNNRWSKDRNGVRLLADYNPRAGLLTGEGHWQTSSFGSGRNPPEGTNPLWISEGNDQGNFAVNHFGSNGFWGPDDATESFVSLFHIPRGDVYSLGELQHADLSGSGLQPAYQIGNSLASPYVRYDEEDLSWRLNQWLWDSFYLGGIDDGAISSGNPRLHVRESVLGEMDLNDPEQQAAMLLIDGSFNINTTLKDAWRVQLAALRDHAMAYYSVDSGLAVELNESPIMLPRLPFPGGAEGELWRGFRALSDDNIDDLADAIVTRIRAHGPFESLSEFVNRDLSAPQGSARNLRGLLADAIYEVDQSDSPINREVDFSGVADNRVAEGIDVPYPNAAVGPRSTHAPGWLSQADILQALGPILTVRGDTFVVRSYGESLNPLTGDTSQAWCEAVVQRMPEYVDENDLPWADPDTISATNEQLGRRFQIIAFRWISADDI